MEAINILYIEDEQLNHRLVLKMLKGTNYQLTVAETAEEGIMLADQHEFNLLLVDLLLPDMNGLELIHEIRRMPHLFSLPIIMLTADTSTINRERVMAYGNTQFLNKPISRWKLLQTIEESMSVAV